MSGPLQKNDQFCGPIGTSTISKWIQEAEANVNIDGIILKVDSPGGTVDGTEDLARTIRNTKKPVVAYVDGLMASAAYWIGSSADEVIANGKTAMIGSIGTMIKLADIQPVLEKAGIKFHEIYATKSTDKNRAFNEALKDGKYTSLIDEILDPLNEVFLSAVQKNRSGKLSTKKNVLTGKVYMAEDAKKHGLIDKIGSMDDAIKSIRVLTKNKNKARMSNTSKFAALSSLLGLGNGFESTEDGIYLQVADIQKLDNILSAYNQLQTGQTAVKANDGTLVTRTNELTAEVARLSAERDAWKAKVEAFSGQGQVPASKAAATQVPSYLDPNNPFNQAADWRQKKEGSRFEL
jgi:signal peptide peptidase SppA